MKNIFTHLLFTFFLFIISTNAKSQTSGLTDGDAIKQIVLHIASDEFKGRETGTKGCEMTEEYFAKEFQKAGLQPIGENGTFFHTYTFPFYKIEGDVNLVINNRKFIYGRDEDYWVMHNSRGGKVESELVFAGYGIYAPDKKRNDFEYIDIKGKVIIIKRGAPKLNFNEWGILAYDSVKADYCFKNGAKGILFYESENSENTKIQYNNRNFLSANNNLTDFPIFMISEKVVKIILESPKDSYKSIVRNLDRKPNSFFTGIKVSMSANVIVDKVRKTRNVLAMIPGTDSKLKSEAIIIGGHMDHVGTDATGVIHNGADDNASGVAIVLGVAQAMMKNKFKPKRTIVFACWTGEEKGLLGSNAWCQKPTWDLSKVVVYFNLDMVGLGNIGLYMPGVDFAADVWKIIKENTDTSMLNKIKPGRGGLGGSDHNGFLKKGIPAFACMTTGEHFDYHQPQDDAYKIKLPILQFVADFMYHSISVVANSNQTFITPTLNTDNIFRLVSLSNSAFLEYPDYNNPISNRINSLSLVNILPKYSSTSINDNFSKMIKNADDCFNSEKTDKNFSFIQNLNELFSIFRQTKGALMPAYDFEAIGYDEVFAKTLLKSGVKITIINSTSSLKVLNNNNESRIKFLTNSGLAVFLKNTDLKETMNFVNTINKPIAFISLSVSDLNNDFIKLFKSTENLYIYHINVKLSVQELMNLIENMKSKIGSENFAISFEKQDEETLKLIQDISSEFYKKYKTDELINSIFSYNLKSFLSKAFEMKTESTERKRSL